MLALPACASIIAGLALTGCVSAQFAPANSQKTFAAKKSADQIEVFKSQSPARKTREIGSVNACCNSNSNKLVDLLKEKAAENGGEAIVGLEPYAGGGMSAAVIRFED